MTGANSPGATLSGAAVPAMDVPAMDVPGAYVTGARAAPLPAGVPRDPRQRRLLALGILGAVLVALLLGVVTPLLDRAAERQEREERQVALLGRLERLAAQAPALRRELDTLDQDIAGTDAVLRAPTASQAAAQLQAAVRRILEAERIPLDSAQVLPGAAQGTLLRVGLRVELRAGIEPLSRALLAFERHRPVVMVREAVLAAPSGAGGVRGAGTPAGGDAAAAPLAVRLDLFALAQVADAARGS